MGQQLRQDALGFYYMEDIPEEPEEIEAREDCSFFEHDTIEGFAVLSDIVFDEPVVNNEVKAKRTYTRRKPLKKRKMKKVA